MMVSREEEQDICEPSESMRVVICSSVCLSVLYRGQCLMLHSI
jgi:hypothetical protein